MTNAIAFARSGRDVADPSRKAGENGLPRPAASHDTGLRTEIHAMKNRGVRYG